MHIELKMEKSIQKALPEELIEIIFGKMTQVWLKKKQIFNLNTVPLTFLNYAN